MEQQRPNPSSSLTNRPVNLPADNPFKGLVVGLLTGALLWVSAAGTAADIGTIIWQQTYNPEASSWNNGFFWTVGFNQDGSILASGFRGEADSDSAIGVRYGALNGDVLDSPAEWFLFEPTWSDYAQDRFHDQYVDASGNIYFVGVGYTASFNSFRPRYNAPNIWKFDSAYSNPAAGSSAPDRPLWRNYYAPSLPVNNEVNNLGQFNNMAVDGAGNIYAVGWYDDNPVGAPNRDWIIDKYDSDGNRALGFPILVDRDGLHDYAYGVATDSDGDVIVAGSFLVDATTDHHNWAVRKYQGDGTLLWATEYDYTGGHDQAQSVTVDGQNDVFVSGYRRNATTSDKNDWYIVKYAGNGDGMGAAMVRWEQSWDDGNVEHGLAYDVAVDAGGNVFVIGIQQMDSAAPVYVDRYRPVLQWLHGRSGALLAAQVIELDATVNYREDIEHDYLRSIALDGDRLLIGGYTQQDGGYSVTRGRTGRVVLLERLPVIFENGFE